MIGTILNQRFKLTAELGRGGMGAVYRAHDTVLDRDVAVKVLSHLSLGTEGREKLLREARAIAGLNHPNIVSVYDAGEADGVPFIVMELVEGSNLHQRPPKDLTELVTAAAQICGALDHAHRRGIVHRDLKPENVLIDHQGTPKLMDFGLARSMASRLTAEGEISGTVFYLAPEIALGKDFDGRADLYSMGVMLYELATGSLPFAQGDPLAVISQHLHASVVPPRAKYPQIPPRLDDLILRLLDKSPENRPATAADVRQLLERKDLLDPEAEEIREFAVLRRITRGRFVGREPELLEARALWSSAREGEGQTLLISGAPGVGKSRFVRELATHVEVTGGMAFIGECEAEAGAPYAPFAQILRRALRQGNQDSLALPEFVLSDVLKLAPELRPYYPTVPENTTLEPEAERQRLFDNVASFCQILSERRPLLLLLEDAHWADSGSLALLRYLARRTRSQRTLLVATYRELELDEARPFHETLLELNRKRLGRGLKLGPLSRPQTRDLLAAIFEEEITPEFLDGIYHVTEGNPFFIEEVCKALVEDGSVYYENGRWHRPSMEELEIPQSVRLAIQTRLSKLPEDCRHALSLAAIIGREFDFETLAAASDFDEDALISALEAAGQAQLVQEVGAAGGVTFSFVHALIAGTVREGVHTLRRRKMHRRVADAIERLRPDDSEALAYHYGEAGDEGRALRYYILAGKRSAAGYAHREAASHFRRALELHPSPADEAELLTELGEVLSRQGRHLEAIDTWRSANDRHRSLGMASAMAQCYARMGRNQWQAGDAQASLDACLEGMTELKEAPPSPELASLVHETGRAYYFFGMPDEARPLCLQALEMSRQAEVAEVEADVLATLGVLPDQSFEEGIAHLRSAVAIAQEHALLHLETRARNNLGVLLADRLDIQEGIEQWLIIVEIARKTTHSIGEQVIGLSNAADNLIDLGELSKAEEMVSRLRELNDQLVEPGRWGIMISQNQASARAARGELEGPAGEWKAYWDDAIRERPWTITGRGMAYADLLVELGAFAEASSVLERVIERSDRVRYGRVRARSLHASVWAMLGDTDMARSTLEEARVIHREWQRPLPGLLLTLAEGYVLSAEQRWGEAWSAFRAAADGLAKAGMRWRRARVLRHWAAEHLTHGEPGDFERARALLEEARAEFEAMGAAGYVEKITQQLQEIPSK